MTTGRARYTGVIFDLFGTLLSTPNAETLRGRLKEENVRLAPAVLDQVTRGFPYAPIADSSRLPLSHVRDLLQTQPLTSVTAITAALKYEYSAIVEECSVAITMHICEILASLCKLDDNALSTIADCREKRVKTAIATNVDAISLAIVRETGIASEVDAVIASCEIGVMKPDPLVLKIAAAKLGVSPEDLIIIGDSWRSDVVGSINAGARAIWIDRGIDPMPHVLLASTDVTLKSLFSSAKSTILADWLPSCIVEQGAAMKSATLPVVRVPNLAEARMHLGRM